MQVTISDAIRYIGVDDKDIDLFESQYVVPEGVSYNSYVILDEKIAVMDTVDARGMEGWEDKLLQTLNGKKPDYLIISHLEPDHAGSIGRMVELFPEVKLVASAKAIAMLPQFFEDRLDAQEKIAVKEGEELSLGTHTLVFYMAPMVHWPEVMVTYVRARRCCSQQMDLVSSARFPSQKMRTGHVRQDGIILISSVNMACRCRHF